jgi:hypothetical protein
MLGKVFSLITCSHIQEILSNEDLENNRMEINISYFSQYDASKKEIEILMSSSYINNPIIRLLHHIIKHKDRIPDYKLSVNFVVNQCQRCKESQFMNKESGCVGAGRYCLTDKNYE